MEKIIRWVSQVKNGFIKLWYKNTYKSAQMMMLVAMMASAIFYVYVLVSVLTRNVPK